MDLIIKRKNSSDNVLPVKESAGATGEAFAAEGCKCCIFVQEIKMNF